MGVYDFLTEYHFNMIFRMLISCLCGIAIGFERKNRAKEAGVRTHCIVACASALMMIISKYGFADMAAILPTADVRLDPSRLAQGIVTGVGFLGAGMIYVQRNNIRGLTTAAGIWATSGIGMAIGSGMYLIGISATVIILLAQLVLHKSKAFSNSHKSKTIKVYGIEEADFQKQTIALLEDMKISVSEVSIEKTEEGPLNYTFYCEMDADVLEEEIVNKFSQRCKVGSIKINN